MNDTLDLPESHFEELEIYNPDTLISKELWIATMKDYKPLDQQEYIDLEGVEFLSPVIAGYMNSPVGVYKKKAIEAKTVKFSDIKHTKDFLIGSNTKIILYTLLWVTSKPIYSYVKPHSFKLVELDAPEFTKSTWIMRFVEI